MLLNALLTLALTQQPAPLVPQPEATPPTTASGRAAAPSQPQAPAPANYRVGPSDALSITVLGIKEYTQPTKPWIDVVVSNSGRLHLPFLGILDVNNKTAAEIEEIITERFRGQGLIKEPQVTVRVSQYRSRTIYIVGEIMQPGQYYMREDMYMLDLLGLSLGWPTSGVAYLYRRGATASPGTADTAGEVAPSTQITQAMPIDFQDLMSGAHPELNVRLEGGDVVYVPLNRPRYFYAAGEVLSPGKIELPPARTLLVSQAVAAAGGPTNVARMSKGMLVRFDATGRKSELPLDFNAIFNGRQPDFPVEENDILFIPNSSAKSLGLGFLRAIPGVLLWW